jgi:hypothetical protein
MAQRVSKKDLDSAAQFVMDEFGRRKRERHDREKDWKEVDRQVAMTPLAQESRDPSAPMGDWMPQIELPNQAWTLEVLAADSARLMFGKGEDWYTPHSMFDDDLGQRIRDASIIHGDYDGIPMGVDNQEFVDLAVRATVNSYHGMYDYRAAWTAMLTEGLKYGTFAGRLLVEDISVVSNDYRGVAGRKLPMIVPVSMWNLYLDPSTQHTLHEGMQIQPSYIRQYWQKVQDVQRAASKNSNGWIKTAVNRLEEKDVNANDGQIEILEMEGDLIFPRSQGPNIVLENKIITVAVTGGPQAIRLRDQKFKFRSYIDGVYQNDKIGDPYGTSPIIKGRILQEWASEAANRVAQTAALNADPPITYDENDTMLAAEGGPRNEPGASFASDNPGAIATLPQGRPGDMFAIFQGVQDLYEKLTGVNDPRRGAGPKSHTTATAEEINLSRSVLRTEDFVSDTLEGAVKNWLYKEWDMIRSMVGVKRPVLVLGEGVNQHIDVSKEILPEIVDFETPGATGVLTLREKRENFLAAMNQSAQIEQLRVQLGMQPMNWDAMLEEMWSLFEVQNANRFFRNGEDASQTDEGEGGLPIASEDDIAALLSGPDVQAG